MPSIEPCLCGDPECWRCFPQSICRCDCHVDTEDCCPGCDEERDDGSDWWD